MYKIKPATEWRVTPKDRAMARALGIDVDELPNKLTQLKQAIGSVAGLLEYLAHKGEPASRMWLYHRLRRVQDEQIPPEP